MPDLRDYLKPGRTPWSDDYNNSRHANEEGCCIVCGKMTKGNGITVALTNGGDTLVLPADTEREEYENGGAYMGEWTVGPECGSKIPQEYRI